MARSKLAFTFLLCAASIFGVSCAAKTAATPTAQEQAVAVQRGNVSNQITATGNLVLSNKQDLAFEMAGYVEQVAVKEGDSVKQGQTLANLNTTDDWEAQITSLQRALTAAQRKVTTTQRNETAAERKVTAAQQALADAQTQAASQVAAKQKALLQSQMDEKNAEIAVANAQDLYHWPDVNAVWSQIFDAQNNLKAAKDGQGTSGIGAPAGWQKLIERETAKLAALQDQLDAMLAGADPNEIATKKTQLQISQANLKAAQDAVPQAEEDGRRSVVNAQQAIDDANAAVDDAKNAIVDAQTAVTDAQKALDKVKNTSPLIKAPLDGFVTLVNVNGGDEVQKGTVAVQVADPTKFEAVVLVSEKDFFKIQMGEDANVQITALSGVTLPAKVTYIAPTATVSQGVANYKIKVEIQSLQPTAPVQAARSQSTASASAKPAGQATQNQTSPSASTRQVAQATSQNVQLSEGLSVTVSITVNQRTNVVVVPNQAIIVQGGQTFVKVSKDNQTEMRQIKTGISDWQYTEVTDGLAEGEQIVYTRAAIPTATTTATPTQKPSGQQPFMPGGLGR